jgi:uncharacterized protein YcfJ
MEKYVKFNNMQTTNRGDNMSFKDYVILTIGCFLFLMITGIANASEYKNVKGSVVGVEAVYENENIYTPNETCSVKEVPIYGQDNNPNIVGAIIGGYLGSKIGGGTGKDIAIGTGAVIGSQMGNKKIVGYKQVRTCETTYSTSLQRVLKYYIVSWKANDGSFTGKARSNRAYAIGDQITVNVVAQPVL